MGSSVGPIYSHFENIDILNEIVIKKAIDMMEEFGRRNWTDIPFLNMGTGFVIFARDEPNLFDVCLRNESREPSTQNLDPEILNRMREDELLEDFSDQELTSIYQKLAFITYGMASLARQGEMGDDSDKSIIRILDEAGGEIIFMAKVRSEMKKPGTTKEDMNKLWRHLDVQ
jgi:hypothetical protein